MKEKTIYIPGRYNYIACFLTLDCNFKCDYCINSHHGIKKHKSFPFSGKKWVSALNRLVSRTDLPITLQGGEPSLHPDFIWIIKNIKKEVNIDILTNLSFDINRFIKEVDPSRLYREAPYPSIRVSYHPPFMELDKLMIKVLKMQAAGFSIGIYGVRHPNLKSEIADAKDKCSELGIDFREKEFLGKFGGKLYGEYFYPEAVSGNNKKKCRCRNSELIIGPDASIFKCHHDLYDRVSSIGNLLDPCFEIKDVFRDCSSFGDCNPCDIKVKTNRFQIYGHTSVEIKDIKSKN